MLTLDDLTVPTPVYDDLAAKYRVLERDLASATSGQAAIDVVGRWDKIRRELETWSSLVNLRFNQDTTNEQYKKDREYCDEITPKLIDLDVRIKRLLLAHPRRSDLERRFGKQAFALWDADVQSFDPAIESHLVQEAKLQAEYNELTAGAKLTFRGQPYNL